MEKINNLIEKIDAKIEVSEVLGYPDGLLEDCKPLKLASWRTLWRN